MSVLFHYSLDDKRQPQWLDEGQMFQERIDVNGNSFDFYISNHEERIIYTTKWLPADFVDIDLRRNIFEYLLKRNMDANRCVFYGVEQASQYLCLKQEVFITSDYEEDIENYRRIRAGMYDDLQNLNTLVDMLEEIQNC